MRIRRLLPAAVLAALLLAPARAGAQAPVDAVPASAGDGVQVARREGRIAFVFHRRAAVVYRRIAGRQVLVECETVDRERGDAVLLRAPRARTRRRPRTPRGTGPTGAAGWPRRSPRTAGASSTSGRATWCVRTSTTCSPRT
jgi:hypothetical protein